MTEQGFDVLANNEISFCGSYLEDYVSGRDSLLGTSIFRN